MTNKWPPTEDPVIGQKNVGLYSFTNSRCTAGTMRGILLSVAQTVNLRDDLSQWGGAHLGGLPGGGKTGFRDGGSSIWPGRGVDRTVQVGCLSSVP